MEIVERVSWTPEQPKIEQVLPGVLEHIRGSRHMEWYIGNGKDGTVFQMFNPDDENDRSFDRFALKEWRTEFRARMVEVDLQQMVADAKPRAFKTPRISKIDMKEGVFVMERVPGKDVFHALQREHRLLSEEMFEEVRAAFRELNEIGIVHGDAHTGNYMLSDMQIETLGNHEVITDAQVWIIDFGHSRKGISHEDLKMVERSLIDRVYKSR